MEVCEFIFAPKKNTPHNNVILHICTENIPRVGTEEEYKEVRKLFSLSAAKDQINRPWIRMELDDDQAFTDELAEEILRRKGDFGDYVAWIDECVSSTGLYVVISFSRSPVFRGMYENLRTFELPSGLKFEVDKSGKLKVRIYNSKLVYKMKQSLLEYVKDGNVSKFCKEELYEFLRRFFYYTITGASDMKR